MNQALYVAIDTAGAQHLPGGERRWALPIIGGGGATDAPTTTAEAGGHLVLFDADGLLDELGERIFTAALDEPAPAAALGEGAGAGGGGRVLARVAHLVAETPWNVTSTARFALDCAAHVLGDAGDVALPNGTTLADILGEARRYLDEADGVDEHRLGFVARLGAARRLQRDRERIGQLAAAAIDADVAAGLDALEDPAWTTVAALGDAVFAAVEALRHLALPRYTASRERAFEADESADEPSPAPFLLSTPFGTGFVGGGFPDDHVPAYVSARDAAERARSVAADRSGESAGASERAWQVAALEAVLTGA